MTETTVRVRDADDLKRLHAEVPAVPPSAVVSTTFIDSGLAAGVEPEHAILFADTLRAFAARQATHADWSKSFDHMLEYAASKGWYDRTTQTIRVHLEARPAEAPPSESPASRTQ